MYNVHVNTNNYDNFTFSSLVRFYYNEFVLIAKKINVCFIYYINSFYLKYNTNSMIKGAGGGPRPKIIFNVIFVEGRQSYQMLFTGSKNINPSRIYRIFKIAKYIQLPCGRALYSRLSQNFKF